MVGSCEMHEMQDPTVKCEEIIRKFEAMTKDAERLQQETLRKILERDGETEYLKKWGLNGRTDPESFKSCVPLVTHADLEPYIQRIADGDTSPILINEPVSIFSLSSGTTNGRPKYLPFNDGLLASTFDIYSISGAYRDRHFPLKRGGRFLEFNYSGKQNYTKGGLKAGTATTNIFQSEAFKMKRKSGLVHSSSPHFSCSPSDVMFGYDPRQSVYCHLLCGLLYSDQVEFFFSTFSFSIVEAFRTFEDVWQELCMNIKEGKLSEHITVPSMRASVSKLLEPNPELADAIYEKCVNLENWYGVIPQIWPNAKYVYSIMTGAMEPYLKKLRHYAGSVPLVSAEYGATEGWVAVNVDPTSPPESASFTVVPNIAYFEFIPLHRLEPRRSDRAAATAHYTESKPVGLTEVKIGQEYEVVITTVGGLYRYRLGDIVKVTGFYNSSPQLSFVCRRNLILTVNIDKTTEKDLQIAVDNAAKLLKEEKLDLLDFTSYADTSTDPGHYVLFWELSGGGDERVLSECCSILDGSFTDPGYVGQRKAKTIGPLELRIVEKGTFRKIVDHFLNQGGAVSQYKTPRCISSNNVLLEILNSGVIQKYFSSVVS